MITVNNEEFTREKALNDISYCLNNVNYKVSKIDKNMFVLNPHFYLNTSDNIKETVSGLIYPSSRILTVGSSGDYMLESIYHGVNEIVNFDINRIQYYVLVLKIWAMQRLEYKEFISFFSNYLTNDFLSSEFFFKILYELDYQIAYPFWYKFAEERKEEERYCDDIMSIFTENSIKLFKNGKINNSRYLIKKLIESDEEFEKFKTSKLIKVSSVNLNSIDYLSNEQNYNRTKENLINTKISFIVTSANELKDKLLGKGQFNNIFLSNIPFYLSIDDFISCICNNSLLLESDGIISCYYQGMSLKWFENKINDPLYFIPENEFKNNDSLYNFNIEASNRSIDAYSKLLETGKFISSSKQIESHGGNINGSNSDVIINFKLKEKIKKQFI